MWGDSLGRFDPADLRAALDGVLSAYPDYPPTLPQFMSLCIDNMRKRSQEVQKLEPPKRVPMPDHIREQLRAFVESHKA